jgi:hypothetical protein
MLLDGLWVGEWHSNVNNIRVSTGVLVFRQGKIFGGTDRVYIIGEFNTAGDRFDGNLKITYYAGEPLGIFGLIDVNQAGEVHITGRCSGDEINFEGTVKRDPLLRMQGTLHKKAGEEIF